MLVVLPVLLLILLAAADMGKFFVISGKSEIAARYIALSHFRQAPFRDAYPTFTAAGEIEGLFFNDALDDGGLPEGQASEDDDPDVTYEELSNEDMFYAPGQLGDPFLDALWEFVNSTTALVPIRGSRSSFTYDLPLFPYGKTHPMEEAEDLPGTSAPGGLAASYDASGHFVYLADAFSGTQGDLLRAQIQAIWLALGAQVSLPAWPVILGVLWWIFL
jgi:hypothetical protein